jgi:hypothetical protein
MMSYRRRASWLVLLVLLHVGVPRGLASQASACPRPAPPEREFVRLCADGNAVAALRRTVDVPAGEMSIADALKTIAQRGGVDITLDATLPALQQRATLSGGRRALASALLAVADGLPLEIDVGTSGGLIVIAASGARERATTTGAPTTDSLRRTAMLERVIVTAARDAEHRLRDQAVSGALTYRTRELASAPGFFGNDVLRTARLLPGFGARNDYSTALNVRGGESDQTLVMLDGIPVYHPFHIGGLLSSFIEPAVGALDLFTGVFPARYNGRLSALIDVRSAEEPRTGVHGLADVNLLASTASLGGTTRSSSTSWLIAGRRTYADVAAALVHRNLPYHFQDANFHATHRLSGGSRLSLTAYAGADVVDTANVSDTVAVTSRNAAVGMSWSGVRRRADGPLGFLRGDSVGIVQRASLTAFDAVVDANREDVNVHSRVRDVRVSGALTTYVGGGSHAVGYELARQAIDYVMKIPPTDFEDLAPRGRESGLLESASGWYDGLFKPSATLLIQGGGRVDVVRGLARPLVSPRLSAKLFLGPDLALTAAVGRHAQWMHSVLREEVPFRLLDFWIGSDSAVPPARAWVYSVGMERWLGPMRQLRIEGYHKRLDGIVVRNTLDDTLVRGDELGIERGRSTGADVLFRQLEHNGFSGWLSYSLAFSRRTGADGVTYAPSQDRRHELNVVGSWRTRRYLFGARFGMATGTPYTLAEGLYQRQRYDPIRDLWARDVNGVRQYIIGPRNGERYPLAHRLDVSLTRIGLNGTARTIPYLSIANVYGAFNPALYVFDLGGSPPERIGTSNFRFLPTFGVRHVF